jgi:hypothetical protein
MPTLQARTTLAPGATVTVDTDTYINIVINVEEGEVAAEAIMDSGQTTGYGFKVWPGAIVVTAASKLILRGDGAEDSIVEVYAP